MILDSLYSNSNGEFAFEFIKLKPLIVRADKEGYDSNQLVFSTDSIPENIIISLQKSIVKVEPGIDLSKVLNIVIYFDFDKYAIREDAKVELEKIVTVLQKYPEIKINLRAHTDSQGPDAYNLKLSKKRAKATLDYLVQQGISKDRLTSEGLGETEILNGCINDVKCSKDQHQQNRRTEFIIVAQ